MIIRRITISSWRAIEQFETELEPRLNLFKGPNEAGKSSIVEAINWGLYRDLVDAGQIKGDITPIIPANNRKARPLVELLLEFPDCTAVIRKTLAEESAQRECLLTIRQPGQPDESYDQAAAQTRLKSLIANGGAQAASQNSIALEGTILLSEQGQTTGFIGKEFSSAARAAAMSIAIGEDGVLAPTQRLEKVRDALEKLRKKELFEKLTAQAVDAAKKSSDAARLRDELHSLQEAHAKYTGIETQIGELRSQIETLKSDLALARQQATQAEREQVEFRQRHNAQLKANSAVADLRRAHDEAKALRDAGQQRIDEITRWKAEQLRAQRELQQAQAKLPVAQTAVSENEARLQAALQARSTLEPQLEASSNEVAAWNLLYDVYVAHREYKRTKARLDWLEDLQTKLNNARTRQDELGKAPTQAQINQWRRLFQEVQHANLQNAHSLRLALRLQRSIDLEWQNDGGQANTGTAAADTDFIIDGAQTISVVLPGIGCLEVVGGGREARKQQSEIETKARSLESQLKPYEVTWQQLPAAFDELEARSQTLSFIAQELQSLQSQYQGALEGGENLEETRAKLADWESHRKSARERFNATGKPLPEDRSEVRALRERDRWVETEKAQRKQWEEAQRNYQNTLAALSAAKVELGALESKIKNASELSQRAEQELTRLQGEAGETDESRAAMMDDLNTRLYQAKTARDAAILAREKLGEAVSDETVAHATHEATHARETQHRLETELAERRMELRGHCEQNPRTQLEELDYEIELRTVELARHEARLRGMAVLGGAIEAQRHRLGRELGTPLNTYLSPWLSALRGKDTQLEFDENGGRIVGIRTGENGSTHILPFNSHSGGMQEQAALVLRLILAKLAAQNLPGQRLPLVLDDPLTQSDTLRREGLWRVLDEASENLQILFVTCHEAQLPASVAHHVTVGEWGHEKPLPPASKHQKRTKRRDPAEALSLFQGT